MILCKLTLTVCTTAPRECWQGLHCNTTTKSAHENISNKKVKLSKCISRQNWMDVTRAFKYKD